MIVLKSNEEIELMAEAASVTADMLEEIPNVLIPGMTTLELDHWCEDYILRHKMKPAFKGYGGFPGTACISVNEEVVHGIPARRRVLKEGDIVSVDLGTIHKGFYSDAARTYPVGKVSDEAAKLIRVTEECFFEGLKFCRKGFRIGDIGHAVQAHAEANGFSVIRDYVGHGVGRDLHEDPQVPNYGRANHGPQLIPGMVIAVEPMIAAGKYDVEVLGNGWTAVTCDRSLAAHYENTIVITDGEPRLLTKRQ